MPELKDQLAQYRAGDRHALLGEDGELVMSAATMAPTEAEMRHELAAPGEAAFLPQGVVWQGPWRKLEDGLGRHCRESAMALAQWVPVRLESLSNQGMQLDEDLAPEVLRQVGHLVNTSFSQTLLSVRMAALSTPQQLRGLLCPAGARISGPEYVTRVMKSTVFYTVFEWDRIDPEIAALMNELGGVWVPCQDNADTLVGSGVSAERVHVVPVPFSWETCPTIWIAAPRGSEDVPDGKRFYHVGKWEPRKNQHVLVGAFLREFRPTERVSLEIKTSFFGNWEDYPSPPQSLNVWANDPEVKSNGWTADLINKRVRIIDAKVSDEWITKLHQRSNVYVSTGLGEAWDIPAFESQVAGNALVACGYGGPREYMRQSVDSIIMGEGMSLVPKAYGAPHGARWGNYDINHLRGALRCVQPPKRRIQRPHLAVEFGRAQVGLEMSRLLTSVYLEAKPDSTEADVIDLCTGRFM